MERGEVRMMCWVGRRLGRGMGVVWMASIHSISIWDGTRMSLCLWKISHFFIVGGKRRRKTARRPLAPQSN